MKTDLDLHLAVLCHATRTITRRRRVTPALTVAQIAALTGATPAQIRTIESNGRLHLAQALRRAGLTQETLASLRAHRHAEDARN